MMKEKVLCFLIFAITMSCAGGGEEETGNRNIDEFRTYKVDALSQPSNIFDFIEEVEVMRLEETENSLLRFVTEAHVLGDQIVFRDMMKGDIYFFSNEGKFEKSINKKGNGPGEYSMIWDLWIDGETIMVFDNMGSSILGYSAEGDVVKSEKLTYRGTHMYSSNSEYMLDMSAGLIEDTLQYNVLFLDENFERKAIASPFRRKEPIFLSWGVNSFAPYNAHTLYHSVFSDTVFVLKNYETEPLFSIDFGDQWLWNNNEAYSSGEKARALFAQGNMIQAYLPAVSEEYVLFTTLKRNGLFKLNRVSGVYQRFDLKKRGEGTYGLNVLRWDGDRMIFSLPSTDVGLFLEELGERKSKFRTGTTLEKIESSENPVLMWVKFK